MTASHDYLHLLLNIDQTLGFWLHHYGKFVYFVLFVIIFGETGFVILPFLPGDSLLFIAGAFGASGHINPFGLGVLLVTAAVLGNTLNYSIGRLIGPRVFSAKIRFLDSAALIKAHAFYEKHGGKTIVLSRFAPLLRSFAPFIAGVAAMSWSRFQLFNIIGGVAWVFGLMVAGYFFGHIRIVRDHLNTIVLLGLAAALVPVVFAGMWRLLRRRKSST